MKTPSPLIIAAALAVGSACAAPYEKLDPDSLTGKNGGQYRASLEAYAQAIEKLSVHAADYPPQFDNDADRQRAIADVQTLAVLAEILQDNSRGAQALPVLELNARLYWIGHNLDQGGFAQKADAAYAALLENLSASDQYKSRLPAAQEEYGRFLASGGQMARAKTQLQAAYRAGRKESAMPLGMVWLAEGNQDEALALLREYVGNFPQDQRAAQFLQAVESGNVEIKSETLKPGK